MESFLTVSNVTFGVGMIGILFGVYKYFKDPQIKTERKDALIEQRLDFMKQENGEKFRQLQDDFRELVKTNQNHIHTIETKVDAVNETISGMGKEIVKLGTILEERLPKGR